MSEQDNPYRNTMFDVNFTQQFAPNLCCKIERWENAWDMCACANTFATPEGYAETRCPPGPSLGLTNKGTLHQFLQVIAQEHDASQNLDIVEVSH